MEQIKETMIYIKDEILKKKTLIGKIAISIVFIAYAISIFVGCNSRIYTMGKMEYMHNGDTTVMYYVGERRLHAEKK